MKNRMTLAEAKIRDRLIYDLALYATSGGMMMTELNAEALMTTHKKVSEKFNQFKKLIQLGEYTLAELEAEVVANHAAIPSPESGYTIDDLDDFVSEYDDGEEDREALALEAERDSGNLWEGVLQSLFSGSEVQGAPEDPISEDPFLKEDDDDEDNEFE